MGSGRKLTEYEKGQIETLKLRNASSRKIARHINYLKKQDTSTVNAVGASSLNSICGK